MATRLVFVFPLGWRLPLIAAYDHSLQAESGNSRCFILLGIYCSIFANVPETRALISFHESEHDFHGLYTL